MAPMRLLSRYILAELLKVFFVTLLGMTMVILLAGIAQEAVRQGLGLLPILRLVPYLLPNALVYAVPGTILFAVCSVYGRMSADNEIVAAKSVGISPMAFLTPGLILAFLVSLTAVWLNDVAASWGQRGVDRVVLQSVEQIAYGLLRTHRVYSTSRFSINIVSIEGRKLIHPTLTFHASEDSPPFTLIAEEAELRLNADKSALSILLTNSEFDWGEKWGGDIPGVAVQEIPLTAASRKGGPSTNHANSTMQEIPQRIGDQIEEMQQMRQQFAAEAAYEMLTGDFGAITGPKWSGYQLQLRDAQTQLYRLQLVPWRRWANGFSCLFFVMVGAPLAIRLRNADIWTSFGVCFLPILLLYYPLLMYGLDRAKCGVLPPYSIWMGNLVLLCGGGWLIYQALRR
jgi:lipopolysaccharide export system permease protein